MFPTISMNFTMRRCAEKKKKLEITIHGFRRVSGKIRLPLSLSPFSPRLFRRARFLSFSLFLPSLSLAVSLARTHARSLARATTPVPFCPERKNLNREKSYPRLWLRMERKNRNNKKFNRAISNFIRLVFLSIARPIARDKYSSELLRKNNSSSAITKVSVRYETNSNNSLTLTSSGSNSSNSSCSSSKFK